MARPLRTALVLVTAFALAPTAAATAAPAPAGPERSAAPALEIRTVARGLEHPWDVQQDVTGDTGALPPGRH